jgi:hypothetical protein
LLQVEKQIGKTPEGLKGPKFPFIMREYWEIFLTLNSTRTAGFSGVNPLSFQEMKNYCDLSGISLSLKDIDIIKRLDGVYMRVMNSVKW